MFDCPTDMAASKVMGSFPARDSFLFLCPIYVAKWVQVSCNLSFAVSTVIIECGFIFLMVLADLSRTILVYTIVFKFLIGINLSKMKFWWGRVRDTSSE